jgi:spermidine synthase
MIPWVELARTTIPGGGEMRLKRRGDEFSIMLSNNELMNSRLWGSEEALATLTCERLARRRKPRLLIGGLGMGFTLRAALKVLGPDAEVEVAELVPAVVDWARGPMAQIFGDCLDDPRVTIRLGDVGGMMMAAKAAYDAILLDVDNGPDGLTTEDNDALYGAMGLHSAHAALKPGGILAVWSAAPDGRFTARLRRHGFTAEEITARARGAKGGRRHVIWLATKR